jgi:hypothetical protein
MLLIWISPRIAWTWPSSSGTVVTPARVASRWVAASTGSRNAPFR